jgi:hypothetical protein
MGWDCPAGSGFAGGPFTPFWVTEGGLGDGVRDRERPCMGWDCPAGSGFAGRPLAALWVTEGGLGDGVRDR